MFNIHSGTCFSFFQEYCQGILDDKQQAVFYKLFFSAVWADLLENFIVCFARLNQPAHVIDMYYIITVVYLVWYW